MRAGGSTGGAARLRQAAVRRLRRPLPAIDSLLAATALTHGLTLVTRNLKDFAHPELSVLDPWQA